MKFIYSNTKEDFFIFYLSQVFLKKTNPVSLNPKSKYYIYNFTKVFNIDKDKIRSLFLDSKTKIQLFKKENLANFKDYNFIYDFYKKIDKEKMDFIINLVNSKLENFIKYLESIFGKSDLREIIEIAFIQQPLKGAFVSPDAFTVKALENKIFFGFDDNLSFNDKEKMNYYTLVIFHELTHLFINHNSRFQMLLKEIWQAKFKYINVTRFRIDLEEVLVCSLVYPFYASGFALSALGFKENQKGKAELFANRTYFNNLYNFLNKLQNNKSKDKFKDYLLDLVETLVKGDSFKNIK